jgi:hypothetical protein
VSVQDVRWDKGGTVRAGIIFFSVKKEMKTISSEKDFLYATAVKRVEFVSDRMSYIVLRCHGCNIILNVHAQSEEKSNDSKDCFYEEL